MFAHSSGRAVAWINGSTGSIHPAGPESAWDSASLHSCAAVVAWTSPSSGQLGFSSTGAFTVAGAEQPLSGHPRHESPWGTVEHESLRYELSNGSNTWAVDFAAATRRVS